MCDPAPSSALPRARVVSDRAWLSHRGLSDLARVGGAEDGVDSRPASRDAHGEPVRGEAAACGALRRAEPQAPGARGGAGSGARSRPAGGP